MIKLIRPKRGGKNNFIEPECLSLPICNVLVQKILSLDLLWWLHEPLLTHEWDAIGLVTVAAGSLQSTLWVHSLCGTFSTVVKVMWAIRRCFRFLSVYHYGPNGLLVWTSNLNLMDFKFKLPERSFPGLSDESRV